MTLNRIRTPGEFRLLFLATLLGLIAYLLSLQLPTANLDPLLLSLVLAIIMRALLKDRLVPTATAMRAANWLIFPGIVCYGFVHLDYTTVAALPSRTLLLLGLVVCICFASILFLGRRIGQRKEITCLVGTGSAICGASAIAITAPAVRARPEDVSISLLAVTLAAVTALFVALPFCGALLRMLPTDYALMSGSLLQFVGFVKTAVAQFHIPHGGTSLEEMTRLALLVKATRYIALIVCIPLAASLTHDRLTFPWTLWLYLIAGMAGTTLHRMHPEIFAGPLLSVAQVCYQILWSTTMAAIGLSADLRHLLGINGYRAFGLALAGFFTALAGFLLFWWFLFPHGAAF